MTYAKISCNIVFEVNISMWEEERMKIEINRLIHADVIRDLAQ